MDHDAQHGNAMMQLSPVNTTGNLPDVGSFRAVLILNAEIN